MYASVCVCANKRSPSPKMPLMCTYAVKLYNKFVILYSFPFPSIFVQCNIFPDVTIIIISAQNTLLCFSVAII